VAAVTVAVHENIALLVSPTWMHRISPKEEEEEGEEDLVNGRKNAVPIRSPPYLLIQKKEHKKAAPRPFLPRNQTEVCVKSSEPNCYFL